MPTVKRYTVLAAAYAAAKKKIGEVPTVLLLPGQTLFRSFNPSSPYSLLPKPKAGTHVSKLQANKLLIPGDGALELENRFSGPSHDAAIPAAAGLYCVLQQQALVNEAMHYTGNPGVWALTGKCVLKMRLMGSMLVADLSPHNPRARRFVRSLGADMWDQMVDPKDCSVARGIGLAIAQNPALRGLSVQTVRESERSSEERGDNLVLFTAPGRAIAGVYIEEAYYFGRTYAPEAFPVAFP
ncbi:MAG: hypothetical protein WBQ08_24205 [Candidatus Sulfotelmatobacter sp.]